MRFRTNNDLRRAFKLTILSQIDNVVRKRIYHLLDLKVFSCWKARQLTSWKNVILPEPIYQPYIIRKRLPTDTIMNDIDINTSNTRIAIFPEFYNGVF